VSSAVTAAPDPTAGPLTPGERRVVERHATAGVALDVIGAHHERYDGGGYPSGIQAEGEALAVVRDEAGRHLDPRVVQAALAISADRWAVALGLAPEPGPMASAPPEVAASAPRKE
jgi:HD-GYP domain-containing protein (c-di-GMP phosphodiesterase class II)